MAPAWEVVADAAGVGDGTSLLDLGCGDGAFCAFAAARGAVVHGIDVEPDAVACALEGVPGADFRLGLMENLPWADASFDVVTAFDSLQYALDPEMALIEAARVLRADGRIAICKWGPPDGNEFFAFLASIGAGGVRGGAPRVSDPVEDAIRSTRLVVLATGRPVRLRSRWPATRRSNRRSHGPESPVVARVIAAAARWRRDDGTYRFDNRQRYWILGGRS